VASCGPTAENHPFCAGDSIEENPNYNPVACAIVLNKCLWAAFEGIWDVC